MKEREKTLFPSFPWSLVGGRDLLSLGEDCSAETWKKEEGGLVNSHLGRSLPTQRPR